MFTLQDIERGTSKFLINEPLQERAVVTILEIQPINLFVEILAPDITLITYCNPFH